MFSTDNFFKSSFSYISKLINDPDNNNSILDPLSCLIRLSMLAFKPAGTKISISGNKISFNEPWIFQGTIRWSQGDNREDLHNLYNPIVKALSWYDNKNEEISNILRLSLEGLNKLKQSYNSNSIIHHTLDHYCNIINNKPDIEKRKTRSENLNNSNSNLNLNINNHIFDELKKLWNKREISIVNNLLLEIEDKYENKNSEIISLTNSIESILIMKEEKVEEILIKTTTILN